MRWIMTGLLIGLSAGAATAAGPAEEFHLRGLGAPWGDWRFAREVKLPPGFTNLSGVLILPGSGEESLDVLALMDGRHTRSRPDEALTRWRLEVASGKLTQTETHALGEPFVDLEDFALDTRHADQPRLLIVDEGAPGPGFLGKGCSTLLHVVSLEGKPLHPAIELREVSDTEKNVCAEGVAVRPEGAGLRLYVLKERNADHSAPRIFEYDYLDPGGVAYVGSRLAGPDGLPDMTAAVIDPAGAHMLVLNRFLMQVVSLDLKTPEAPFFKVTGQASYRTLEQDILHYGQSKFPMAEGLAVWKDHMLMSLDNNTDAIGDPPDKAARVLWFRQKTEK